ncbi:ABC transporter ATP-binding protein [Anaerobacillus alkaliphilus]|uniref:ABC transporter ATP-binding protein n=1 Tax=Anaerobacillus alkaliphilus TaxID=1548597 RepID=A0A4Q0VRH0_9BACI|nr:ATP-binding cassette domain-containing protein [Anaerobacillus alkaliphilus]RXI99463.1 ABC transporter ATP-binding protein [Anaerobacillus alkaliphilus]
MSILSLNRVWKRTDNAFWLKNITFEIHEGDWLLISGPVGQGKEELQQILLGFDTDWDGEILLHKKSIKEITSYNDKIAFIPNMIMDEQKLESVYEYLAFPLKIQELSEEKIAEEIHSVAKNIDPFIDLEKPIKELSFKEGVLITCIRAILSKPSLIIIDEPFYQFPNSKRKEIIHVVKEFHDNWAGCPVVIFSSYNKEWLSFVNRLAIIQGYELLQIGDPKSLVEEPKSIFVAKYIHGEGFTLLRGKLKGNHFTSNGFSCSLPLIKFSEDKFYEGQDVVIGIHATSFQINEGRDTSDIVLKVPVHIVLEEDFYYKLYTNVDSQPLVAHVKKSGKMNEGEQIQLSLPFENLLFFDRNTEKRLM